MTDVVTPQTDAADPAQPGNLLALEKSYEEALQLQPMQMAWADALDAKAVAIFGVASLAVTLVPALTDLHPTPTGRFFWVVGLVCWAAAAYCCLDGLFPRPLKVGPDPVALLDASWSTLPPEWFYRYRLENLGEGYTANRVRLNRKAIRVRVAMLLTSAETVALALFLLSAPS